MIDAQEPLQKALYDALVADVAVGNLVGDRIYDRVPKDPGLSYISFGSMQSLDDSHACAAMVAVYVDVDCWSREVGTVVARRLAAAVAKVLDAPLTVEGFVVTLHRVDTILSKREPDGLTSHSVVRLRYDLQATA